MNVYSNKITNFLISCMHLINGQTVGPCDLKISLSGYFDL